ncbi:PQQ-like beta-propeller repeat protein [Streptomyces sp. NBC_01795]|uniref:outer membrane protein assembly factor BamB family protein n=1 Tax=unclassified Streptomyces TaxID=2593676 RepID=UPI002DDB2F94|nr:MULTISPECIES: PQQ-binding-like beta-propeller repeat protein [unclassified Streptomyces]WSA94228.1 PQQ-like beta-propeller repeat protein [Streptomyces sp. NBC_01795]WSB78646.1 PQQ-like beta-propeller repeat protein [Streptomyces sp. NBC_01775]WSS13151.1 PQQ-like beta-propeller repeat protein [Streptomyces sp. NBC_01186]
MSQPPPPPSQPPSGGYGAPQEPPQGQPSYGYPAQPGQTPPPPPQAPGTPPPAPGTPPPGPYGQQQPPAGYGYPQGQQQPGYGYPQTPAPQAPTQTAFGAVQPPSPPGGPYGQQQPGAYPYGNAAGPVPGGGGGGNNSKVIGIVAAVVAVVLVAGLGVFFLTKDDGKEDEAKKDDKKSSQADPNAKPKNTSGKQIVDMKAPEVNDVTTVTGAWATDKVYAKSSVRNIIVQDLKTKQQSKIPLKGNVCAASNGMTKDHKVAVVVQETISNSADCTRMVIVDLDKKAVAWDKTMPNSDTRSNENVAISGDTVASAWIGGSVGYKISTKKKLWEAQPSNCRDTGYQGGKSLVVVVECGNDLDNPEVSVQKLDPNTGKAKWKYEPPKGIKNVRVASTDPMVLVAGAGDELASDVLTVGDDKKLKAKISLGKRYNKPCELEVDGCYGMAVGPDTVYLSTAEHPGASEYGDTNEIMAFDFNTGKTKWKAAAGEKRTIVPFKMQGQNVLGYKPPSYDSGGQVVTIEPKGGKQTKLLQMPVSDIGKGEQAFSVDTYSVDTQIIFEHNRLFLDDKLISERRASQEEIPRLAVGFGAE